MTTLGQTPSRPAETSAVPHHNGPSPASGPGWVIVIAWLCACILAVVIVRVAWLSDDACITLRTVHNALEGHGLRWNPVERVQTYTHPLWMFLLIGATWLSGDMYVAALGLGMVVTVLACIALVFFVSRGAWFKRPATPPSEPVRLALVAVPCFAILFSSKAFTEFATSGLENPATHLCIALFAIAWFSPKPAFAGRCSFWLAIAMCVRLDLVCLLAVPLGLRLVAEAWGSGGGVRAVLRSGAWAAVCGWPLWCWLGFATIYYGTPLPNTAYAKALGPSIDRDRMLDQGMAYFSESLRYDPVTLGFTVLATLAFLVTSRVPGRVKLLAVGVPVWFGYVLYVGGDFMSGRFFTGCLFLGLCMLTRSLVVRRVPAALVVAILAFGTGLTAPAPALFAGPNDTEDEIEVTEGIINERQFYLRPLGLFSEHRTPLPVDSISQVVDAANLPGTPVIFTSTAGLTGITIGQSVQVVDPWLCDPLLVRLPMYPGFMFRIGHFTRRVPEGYLESLAREDVTLIDERLQGLSTDLKIATRAPLWDGDRWSALWRLWTGEHSEAVADYASTEYLHPPEMSIAAADLSFADAKMPFWQVNGSLIYAGGLRVTFPQPVTAAGVRALLGSKAKYEVTAELAGQVVARFEEVEVPPAPMYAALETRLEFAKAELPTGVDAAAVVFDSLVFRRPHSKFDAEPPCLLAIEPLQ